MTPESAIIETVESYVLHQPFEGSQEIMTEMAADLDRKAETQEISEETRDRLRTLILSSHHFRTNQAA